MAFHTAQGFRTARAGQRYGAGWRKHFMERGPLREVVRSCLMAEGHRASLRRGVHTFRRDVLECGHIVETGWDRSTIFRERQLDAAVSETVMGEPVAFTDWSCGYSPDDGRYGACGDRNNQDGLSWYNEPGPVVIEHGFAHAVPFYSSDIGEAFRVEDCGFWYAGFTQHNIAEWNGWPDCTARGTPARAICLAALAAVKSRLAK